MAADSPFFDTVAQGLEKLTRMDRLQARGTLRLALKSAGLDAATIKPAQMRVVLERMLPSELKSRGVQDFVGVCASLIAVVDAIGPEAGVVPDAPEDLFVRTRERAY